MESAHPLVVHFPIALLLTGLACDACAQAFKRAELRQVGLWNLSLGAVGAGVAVLTGLRAEEVAKHSFEIWKVLEWHKRLGFATLILALTVAGWRLLTRDRLTTRARLVVWLVTLVMAGTMSWGAHLGGRLVYEFGLGGSFGMPSP